MNRNLALSIVGSILLLVAGYELFTHNSDKVSAASTSSALEVKPSPTERHSTNAEEQYQRKAELSIDYSNARNLNSYIADLSTKPSPPGTLDLAQAKAWDECGSLIARPNSAAQQISQIQASGGKYAEFRIKALKQVETRCKDFAFSTRLTRDSAQALYADAAQKGNPEAAARILVDNLASISAGNARKQVMDILTSGNPAAIFYLADAFGERSPFEMSTDGLVGTSNARYAWQLVACDRGMDCSASSAVVQSLCLGIGLCGPGDYRTNVQYSPLSQGDYQQVRQIEYKINGAIANGSIKMYLNHN